MRLTLVAATLLWIFMTRFFGSCGSCKEALCASVVSKCLLIDACKCDVINCSCCKACFQCLETLFVDCCECVDMCPKAVTTLTNLSSTSHVEDLPDPLVELFNALTEEHDATLRWTTYTYAVHRDLSPFLAAPGMHNIELGVVSKTSPVSSAWAPINCTVAFMAQCMPWTKCKNACRSMGASSYRWFHDGCCQCVGHNCLNYGMNETRCMNCPRMATGTVDDEYEGPDEDDRPRKHMETFNTEDVFVETSAEERSYNSPPPYGLSTPPKSMPKTLAPAQSKNFSAKAKVPFQSPSVTRKPSVGFTSVRPSG